MAAIPSILSWDNTRSITVAAGSTGDADGISDRDSLGGHPKPAIDGPAVNR